MAWACGPCKLGVSDAAEASVHSVQPQGDQLCSSANHIETVEQLYEARRQAFRARLVVNYTTTLDTIRVVGDSLNSRRSQGERQRVRERERETER